MADGEMLGWRLSKYGSINDLELTALPIPAPEQGRVLIKVHAAALNFADGIMIEGKYQVRPTTPFIMGAEVAGVVVGVPEGCLYAIGDRVAAQIWTGGYAEYCLVDEYRLFHIPDGMDFAAAAAFPISYTTAHVGLSYPVPVKATDVVLVHAAAGGIGIAATQLAKAAGATVIATASSAQKLEIAKQNGADITINYREADWVSAIKADFPDGIQMVIDPVGDAFTNESLRCLGWRGHLRLVGFAAGKPAKIPANHLLVKAATATGVYWNFENDGELIRTLQDELVDRMGAGALRPLIGGIYPLAAYREALKSLEDGQTVGKIILTMV